MNAMTIVDEHPTLASVWQTLAEGTIHEGLLEWPPDVFALIYVLLERSETLRTLHAIADDACAGLCVGLTASAADGRVARRRGACAAPRQELEES